MNKSDFDEGWKPLQEIRRRQRKVRNKEDIAYFFKRLVTVIAAVVLIFGLVFGIKPVMNDDMKPVMKAGDAAVYYRWDRSFVAQDLVVYSAGGRTHVGRIVARPGDEVNIPDSGGLQINGYNSYEENIYYDTKGYADGISYPVRMGNSDYFLLGDHRDGARDSRYYGPVKESAIKGKVIAVIRWVAL